MVILADSMITLSINNQEIRVPEGTTIMGAADALGVRIPRLCFHPRLSIAGNCRICGVHVEGEPGLVLACATVAREGMRVETETAEVRRARADILEFLLLNHPLDCPVCDRAGECDLQDLYFEYSLQPSRSREPKVKKPKAQVVGEHVILDAERCVACTRCIRMSEEVAGRRELDLLDRGDQTQIAVTPGRLEHPYSLCTVDLCPVGALTSRAFRFRERVWRLTRSPTICGACGRGCRVWLDHAKGVGYRLRPRECEAVNRSWMCDVGRASLGSVDDPNRVLTPQVLEAGALTTTTWDTAMARVRQLVLHDPEQPIAIVLSPHGSNEENAALAGLVSTLGARARLFRADAEEDPGFEDEILRHRVRAPNMRGLTRFATETLEQLPTKAGVILLERVTDANLMTLIDARPAWVIQIATTLKPQTRWIDVVLPRGMHFEQGGTFENVTGACECVQPVLPARGESVSAVQVVERMTEALA